MIKLEFRHAVRPGYRATRSWRTRPIGVYRASDGRFHWSCRLDCWAALTSGWYLPSQQQAIGEGVAHLIAFHYPCELPTPGWYPITPDMISDAA